MQIQLRGVTLKNKITQEEAEQMVNEALHAEETKGTIKLIDDRMFSYAFEDLETDFNGHLTDYD